MRFRSLTVPTIVILAFVAAPPAFAAPDADTVVTFTVAATDGLNITAPATATLATGAGTPGTTISGQLVTVAVSDERSALDAPWTATVELLVPFETGGGSPSERITGVDVDYAPGSPTVAPVGNGTFTPGADGDLATTRTAFTHTGGPGDNSVGWAPTLTVNIPATAVAGTYTGTVRHSVA